MHEMALAEGVLGILEDAQRRQGFERIRVIRLEIGALAGVELEALRTCLEIALGQGVAHGARLEWDIVPGSGFCFDCGQTVELDTLYSPCRSCGGPHVEAVGGMQMRVRDLLVE